MNGKLYIIGIGGSGARVMKSLMMLFAAGVQLDAQEVVPILIDLDKSNGNLAEAQDILETYKSIRQAAYGNEKASGFFSTKVSLPKGITSHALNLSVLRDGIHAQQISLADFINYESLNASNSKHLVDCLYSRKDLENNLAIGFRGQPHIGAITFYNITRNQNFVSLCQELNKEDRILFVSSIFGGTGASGFPTLLKIMRDTSNGLPNQKVRSDIKIGALLLLPYFNLEDKVEGETIDANLFMTKSKVALSYYSDHLEGYDAMYYLSEPRQERKYNNEIGAEKQKNGAHFIELFGALAAGHFMFQPDDVFEQPQFFEYSSKNEAGTVMTFADVEEKPSEGQIAFKSAVSAMAYLYKYFFPIGRRAKDFSKGQEWPKILGESRFFNSSFFKEQFKRFLELYADWLKEMEEGNAAFSPFQLGATTENMGEFIKGQSVRINKTFFSKTSAIDLENFNTKLNAVSKNLVSKTDEGKFLELMQKSVIELFQDEKLFQ